MLVPFLIYLGSIGTIYLSLRLSLLYLRMTCSNGIPVPLSSIATWGESLQPSKRQLWCSLLFSHRWSQRLDLVAHRCPVVDVSSRGQTSARTRLCCVLPLRRCRSAADRELINLRGQLNHICCSLWVGQPCSEYIPASAGISAGMPFVWSLLRDHYLHGPVKVLSSMLIVHRVAMRRAWDSRTLTTSLTTIEARSRHQIQAAVNVEAYWDEKSRV